MVPTPAGASTFAAPARPARPHHASGRMPGELVRLRTIAAMVEASDDAIISKTLDGKVRSWNSGA